uniref:helix-turn-helix domain-containing protein n=1 Tax=unclassified Bifidobacterium TaxID=2608897 RepID=UPI0018DB15A8|nr:MULTISPECIES: helix-turn-helix transcriptional regulator [unclassified Bifidobacterium]MBH9978665.1 helix-turn-helix transcriptional regulator [Bifidobacterium sp. W8108]MBI0173465.1 helix-turn-helix transcriptional regulator [Bifidobacterium sp. M0307]
MNFNQATAKALHAARVVSGLTYDELAKKTGMNIQTIYRVFGAKGEIKVTQVASLGQAMDLTPSQIMEDAQRILERTNVQN